MPVKQGDYKFVEIVDNVDKYVENYYGNIGKSP